MRMLLAMALMLAGCRRNEQPFYYRTETVENSDGAWVTRTTFGNQPIDSP